MEMTLSNGFCEVSEEEMNNIEGGLGTVGSIVAGCIAAWAIDGACEAYTGKTVSGWIATGLQYAESKLK